jgi:carboxymethylenebutenolidase
VRLPPTIIVHGANDSVSPVANAYALQAMLQSFGTPYQMFIYPNEGHALNPTDQADALQRTLTFFQTYLH